MALTPEQLARAGTEHAEQSALFCWAATQFKWTPELQKIFAIPNGGQRGDGSELGATISGGRFKAEGVKSGVPDVFLPLPNVKYHGLFIEMKRIKYKTHKNGGMSDEQIEWSNVLRQERYLVVTCYGWLEARDIIIQYIQIPRIVYALEQIK